MKKAEFRVGDCVTVPLGVRRVQGTIVEDRGPIGSKGRRFYRVEVPMDPFDSETYERPEDDLESAEKSNSTKHLPSKAAVIEYLKNGGLILMLQANMTGGRNQPRVWITWDTLGNLTHTFTKERGLVGGETPPVWAMHEERVFSGKRDEVLDFLRTFALSKDEAEDVVAAVGTAP